MEYLFRFLLYFKCGNKVEYSLRDVEDSPFLGNEKICNSFFNTVV